MNESSLVTDIYSITYSLWLTQAVNIHLSFRFVRTEKAINETLLMALQHLQYPVHLFQNSISKNSPIQIEKVCSRKIHFVHNRFSNFISFRNYWRITESIYHGGRYTAVKFSFIFINNDSR